MSKYAESEYCIKEYGLEKCKMIDAYYENEQERKDKLLSELETQIKVSNATFAISLLVLLVALKQYLHCIGV